MSQLPRTNNHISHKHGAPFINLVMCVPLRDQRGALRYYLGAQLDITSFFDNHSLLSSLRELIEDEYNLTGKTSDDHSSPSNAPHLKEFEELIESFDKDELDHLVLYERRKALLPEGIFLKHDRPLEDLRQSESMYTAGVTNQIMNRAFGFYPKVRAGMANTFKLVLTRCSTFSFGLIHRFVCCSLLRSLSYRPSSRNLY